VCVPALADFVSVDLMDPEDQGGEPYSGRLSAPVSLRRAAHRSVNPGAGTLICEVSDASHTAPHLRRAKIFDEGGRGLLLAAQLTERWGSRHTPEGKTIWAELTLDED
jgi:hypothetical protein